jgi:hypothetical protein
VGRRELASEWRVETDWEMKEPKQPKPALGQNGIASGNESAIGSHNISVQSVYFSIAQNFYLPSPSRQSLSTLCRVHPSYDDKAVETVPCVLISGNSSPSPFTPTTAVFSILEVSLGDD